MAARKILARPQALTPAVAAAPGFDLKTWEAQNR
jgi:3-phenylpropionate/trans-cinnamate dioxygenase ferredoxin reductase subunit